MPSKEAYSGSESFHNNDYDDAADTRAAAQALCSSIGSGVSCWCKCPSSQAAFPLPLIVGSLCAPAPDGVRMGHWTAQNAVAW